MGGRAVRRPRLVGGCPSRSSSGGACGIDVATGASRARAAPGEHPSSAIGRNGVRPRSELHRLGTSQRSGPGGRDGHAPVWRSARPGRQSLHRQSAQSRPNGSVHAQRESSRGVRAALHLPRLSVCGRRRTSCSAGLDHDHGHRRVIRPRADRESRDLGLAAQPAASQHRLGSAQQFSRRAD